jgi:hypothetical protein
MTRLIDLTSPKGGAIGRDPAIPKMKDNAEGAGRIARPKSWNHLEEIDMAPKIESLT